MAVTIGDSGGTTTTTTPPKTAPPPPTVYWFNGKAYYSYDSYLAAVEAYQMLLMKQRAANTAASQAAALKAAQEAAAKQAATQLLQQRTAEASRISAAELAAARDRALQLQLQAAADRAEQQQILQMKLAAARRYSEQQALLARQRTIAQIQADQQDQSLIQQMKRRTAEQAAAAARHAAYEQLQSQVAINRWRLTRSEEAFQAADLDPAVRRAVELQLRDQAAHQADPNHPEDDVVSIQYKADSSLINRARQTGDWSLINDVLDKQSESTGGRYTNPRLEQALNQGFFAPILDRKDQFESMVDQAMSMVGPDQEWSDDELRRALEFINSAEFKSQEEWYYQMFGEDARGGGTFQPYIESWNNRAEARERLWIATMAGANTMMSDSEIDRYYNQAASQWMTAEEGGDLQAPLWADVERYIDPSNPAAGTETVRVYGQDAWIEHQNQALEARLDAVREQQHEWIRLARMEGFANARFEDGEFKYDDLEWNKIYEQLWGTNGMNGLLPPKWRIHAGEAVPIVIQRARDRGDRATEEVLFREFMQDVGRAWDAQSGPLRALYETTYGRLGGNASRSPGSASAGWMSIRSANQAAVWRVDRAWQQTRTEYLMRVARRLDREWGKANEFFATPIGEGIRFLGLVGAAVIASLRSMVQSGDRAGWKPYIGFSHQEAPGPAGVMDLGPLRFGSFKDPAAERRAQAEFARGLQSDDPAVLAQAILDYGMGWVQGELGWILEGLADPTLGMGLSARPFRLGRLALSGGDNVSARLRALWSYLAPQRAGGLARHETNSMLIMAGFASHIGADPAVVRFLSRQDLENALKLADDPIQLQATKFWDVVTSGRLPSEMPQLLRMAEQILPALGKAAGLAPVSAPSHLKFLRSIREAFIESRTFAAEEALNLAARTTRKQAMAKARQLGAAIPADLRPALQARQTRKFDRLAREYQTVAEEYEQLAGRAMEISTKLDTGEIAVDAVERFALQQELQQISRRLRLYVDKWGVGESGQRFLEKKGRPRRALERLEAYRRQLGGDPDAPPLSAINKAQIRQDRANFRSRLRTARIRRRKFAPGTAAYKAQTQLIRDLVEALRGLEYEELLLGRGPQRWRALGRKERARVRDAVSPRQIGHAVSSEAEINQAVAGDLYAQLVGAGPDRQLLNLTPAQGTALETLVQRIRGEQLVRPTGQTQADNLIRQLFDELGIRGTISLEEAWIVARMVSNSGDATWRQISNYLNYRVLQTIRFRGGAAQRANRLQLLARYLDEEHMHMGRVPVTWDEYAKLDTEVRDALRALGRRREGQVRPQPARVRALGLARRAVYQDSEPQVILAKMRTLRQHGISIFEYDEARGVLGSPLLKENTTRSLWKTSAGPDARAAMRGALDERAALEAERTFADFAALPEMRNMSPQMIVRAFEEQYLYRDLLPPSAVELSHYQRSLLQRAFELKSGLRFTDTDAVSRMLRREGTPDAAPIGSRRKMHQWFVDMGWWKPRVGQDIAEGGRVWTLAEERAFYEGRLGFVPPWADGAVMSPLLNDSRLLNAFFRSMDMFEGSFEEVISGLNLTTRETQEALAWGLKGVKRQRTAVEMRSWMLERYGPVVRGPRKTLARAPWLMSAEGGWQEYRRWLRDWISPAGIERHRLELLAARDRLPQELQDLIFKPGTDELTAAAKEIDYGKLQASEIEDFVEAFTDATINRLERLKTAGNVDPVKWLPQEQLKFAYEVMSDLMLSPSWQKRMLRARAAGGLLSFWASIWRLLISWVPAFPIINVLDSVVKKLALGIYETGGFFPYSEAGARIAGTLREAGLESSSVFGLSDNAFLRVGNKMLPWKTRAANAGLGVAQAPLMISAAAENRLRLWFYQMKTGAAYRDLIASGVDKEAAETMARFEGVRLSKQVFATIGDNNFMKVLNQLIPFFSYFFNLKKFALRFMVSHPSALVWGQRIGDAVERANREAWEQEHPGVPFPEGDQGRQFWLKIGDDYYTVDFSQWSDWARGAKGIIEAQTMQDLIGEFFRIPHPTQAGLIALLTGEYMPWGKPPHPRELLPWYDWLLWMQGQDYEQLHWQRDAIQMLSQIMFFRAFGKITPLLVARQTYFGLQDVDPALARAYLREHPELELYFSQLSQIAEDRNRPGEGLGFNPDRTIHRRQLMTDEENDRYETALDGWEALNNSLEQQILPYANEPWADEYKAAKRRAFILQKAYLAMNPILVEVWTTFMSPSEFSAYAERFKLDMLTEAWFRWGNERPRLEDYPNKLAYQKALVAFYQARQDFLEANPALYDRLFESESAIENAWHQQELHWAEILEFQARIKVRILEEETKGDAANRDLISDLYRVSEASQVALNAESYEVLYGELDVGTMANEWRTRTSLASTMERLGVGGLTKRIQQIPGFADFLYDKASPAERLEIERNERYAKGIAAIVKRATSGQSFYELLQQDPWLLAEYWRRNPDKKASFLAGREYFRWISSWVNKLKVRDFQGARAVWDSMPEWVRARYLAKHPDSKIITGQQYFAAISRWAELLKAKKFDEAAAYFDSLPDWVKERYFANHPEQRAQAELDNAALRAGANYFLASGADKLKILEANPELRKWLLENGGDEAAMRGLIMAIYRAIPSTEAWLKRTFRQHFPEVFSVEAQGQRRLRSVAQKLADSPGIGPFYEEALKLQQKLFTEQLKLNKTPPKPWTMERAMKRAKARRRRFARQSSSWTMHRDLRLGR